jgi:hypothetical protein
MGKGVSMLAGQKVCATQRGTNSNQKGSHSALRHRDRAFTSNHLQEHTFDVSDTPFSGKQVPQDEGDEKVS